MLTNEELEILGKIAELASLFGKFAPIFDRQEWVFHIHGLQNMVLANDAARQLPGYRLTGGNEYVPRPDDDGKP